MRVSIPNKTRPKAKQHGYWFGQDGRKCKKSHFSGNFDLFSGICVVHPLNFSDIFAETNTTTFFKIMPIKSFLKQTVLRYFKIVQT